MYGAPLGVPEALDSNALGPRRTLRQVESLRHARERTAAAPRPRSGYRGANLHVREAGATGQRWKDTSPSRCRTLLVSSVRADHDGHYLHFGFCLCQRSRGGRTTFQTHLDLGITDDAPGGMAGLADALPHLAGAKEPRGVVYTRPWVAGLILDLAGYRADEDLTAQYAMEPSAGEGAFLVPMVRRLLASLAVHGRKLSDARESIRAYELDADPAAHAMELVVRELREQGAGALEARQLAEGWVSVGDYLLKSPHDRRADLVVGNPPYIRYDDLPAKALSAYRRLYPAMVGRCDIYVGFIEAGLRQLKDGGVLGLICADRWMRSAYGAELRRMITSAFGVEAVIEMHDAPAFENVVAAYPAVIVVRRGPQEKVTVASAGPEAGPLADGGSLAERVTGLARGRLDAIPGFAATTVDRWFRGTTPWPSLQPRQLRS